MPRTLFTAIALLSIAPALQIGAAPQASRLEEARSLLEAGQPQEALTIYQDLLVDDPNSALLHFNTGCAYYALAEQDLEDSAAEAAQEALGNAAHAFEQAAGLGARDVRGRARYNLANIEALRAKLQQGSGEHEATLESFEKAIREYETVVNEFPEREDARHNLEHMRFLLKQMLQNPPEQQQQEQQQQGGEDEEGEEEDEQQQPQPPEEQEEQQQEQGAGEEQRQPEEEQQQDEAPGEEQPEPQEGDGQDEQDAQPEQTPAGQTAEPELPDRQILESLLESLEEQDRREQRDRRDVRPRRLPTRWWW